MVYTEHAELAAPLSGTNHVGAKQNWNYSTWVDIQSTL